MGVGGGMSLASRVIGGGIEAGGSVCIFPPGGGGGVKGMFSGGIVESELGATGENVIGPGGGGVASVAVLL